MAMDNKTLGRFQLTDIPPAPRGVPQIEVSFDIDANGIVSVKAKDLGTNKEQKIVIKSDTGLSEAEIDRMIKEAEENAEADQKRKEEADLRNEADQLIFAANKALEDLKDDVTDEEKTKVNDAVSAMQEALKGSDLDEIKAKRDALNEASQAVAMKAYEKASKASGMSDQAPNGADDVVEADFEEVDDVKEAE